MLRQRSTLQAARCAQRWIGDVNERECCVLTRAPDRVASAARVRYLIYSYIVEWYSSLKPGSRDTGLLFIIIILPIVYSFIYPSFNVLALISS